MTVLRAAGIARLLRTVPDFAPTCSGVSPATDVPHSGYVRGAAADAGTRVKQQTDKPQDKKGPGA